ncbi:MAG: YsnF/AvaK domain-containing protein [Chloroflexota bacterium]|nr:YsnF/AvaK domain-containing protein [Chloroflexota bacterium]
MAQQLVAAYEDIQAAQTMADYLTSYVDHNDDIKVITSDDHSMFMYVKGQMNTGDGFDYERVLQEGGAILLVKVDDDNANRIEAILNGRTYTEATTTTAQTTSSNMADTRPNLRQEGQERVELVEEELQVGKRTVEGGDVRVSTRIVEEPVREDIRLRDERVNVERRTVDRPLSGANEDLFRERTIEMSERHEEPVISKQARVVEEVMIGKDVQERVETVSDTVRRTEVEIERENGHTDDHYDRYTDEYRRDFDTRYGSSGAYTFDHFSPAYRLGHGLASDSRYEQYGWDELEPSARTFWETNYSQHGAWDDFKDAARHAWQSERNR